jgi:L-asparaginase
MPHRRATEGTEPVSPRIAVFSLGGTIAMTPAAGGGGVVPALSPDALLAAVPGLGGLDLAVEVHDFRRLPGASLGFVDLLDLAGEIDRQVASGVDGVVVSQGTDTIEETAYLLDLLHAADAPVVVTGAMRSAQSAGADGPANLLAALRVAASSSARGLGCLVVFADEVHAARRVRKAHTTSIRAFASDPGPLGAVVEDEVRIPLRPARGAVLAATAVHPSLVQAVRVPVVTTTLGDDGTVLEALAERSDGLVIAAFGAGHVPATWVPALADLAGEMPVVLASRTGAGSVLSSTYGFPGAESDLLARGLISAGDLHPVKARLLLHLLLATGAEHAEIASAVAAATGCPAPGGGGPDSAG